MDDLTNQTSSATELPLAADAVLPPTDIGLSASAMTDFLSVGGPVLWVLAGLSVVTLALVLTKTLQFGIARAGSRSERGGLGIVKRATDAAIRLHHTDRALIEDAGRRAARQVMRPLEGGLSTLGMIAMLSPLIGLLGTVIGMIGAFQALEKASSTVDPSVLSSGIWVALLTTAAGLVVAIPATLAHGWFEGRLARFADEAECLIGETMAETAREPSNLRIAAE